MSAPVAASCGLGTNSTAMLIGMVERGERVDKIMFADTGGERPRTYAFRTLLSDWLVSHGYPAIETVYPRNDAGEIITLEQDCLDRSSLPSIVFGIRSCSDRFKQRPQNNYIVGWATVWPVVKLIGFDADEPQRAKESPDARFVNRFPLLEWNWGREECERAIVRAGLPLPGKSACFFCPSSTKPDVRQLKREYPELLDRAIEMERRALPMMTDIDGLGRHWSWENQKNQTDVFDDGHATEKPCACYDG